MSSDYFLAIIIIFNYSPTILDAVRGAFSLANPSIGVAGVVVRWSYVSAPFKKVNVMPKGETDATRGP